ncbi:MAG: tetratricopeptide repeat protein [Candidatus Krumholzibacteriota bacterium]|nr:tetratricopeptide repeat protein [Candidatus Krumholzibacteriota bacterium]
MSKATQLRQRAQIFLKKGKIENAIEQYQKLLTVEARNPNLYNELGDIYLRAGEKMLAVSSFEKASANYEKVALYNNAVAVCKKILRTVPNRVETIYKLGEIKTKQKFMGEAETYFLQYFDLIQADQDCSDGNMAKRIENILELAPDSERIWERAAEAYSDLGIKSKAAETFAQLLSKTSKGGDSEKTSSYRSRLDLLKKSLKPDEISEIDKICSVPEPEAVESEGVDSSGIDIVGNSAGMAPETESNNDTGEAVAESVESVTDSEEESPGIEDPDIEQEFQADSEKIEAEIDSGEEPVPGGSETGDSVEEDATGERNSGLQEMDVSVSGSSGEEPVSKEEISATPSEDLSDIIEQEDKEIEKETSEVNLAEDISSDVEEDDFRSHYDLGMAYIEMRLFDDALKELQISSRSEQLQLQSLEMIGQCFIEINNPHLAVKQLKRGLELTGNANGDNLGIHYNLGLAYEALGESEKAREHFEEVYIVDVTFRDISVKMKKFSSIS